MYVLAPNQFVEKYPYSIGELRKDNPNTSFPANPGLTTLASYNVFPVVSVGVTYDPATQVALQEGCLYNTDKERWETSWTVRDKTAEEISQETSDKAAEVRSERNKRLASSDWTQVDDTPISNTEKTLWASYRQTLRTVTDQPGFPWNVLWPKEPN